MNSIAKLTMTQLRNSYFFFLFQEDKMKEMAIMEKERVEAEAREAAMQASMKDNKKKLLDDLAAEDAKREAAVKDIQKLKDKEKADLMGSLHSGMCCC